MRAAVVAAERIARRLRMRDAIADDVGLRAVREQVNWNKVRNDTADNDFAAAFLFLTDRLGITA